LVGVILGHKTNKVKHLTKYPPGDYQPLLFGYKICKEWLVGLGFFLKKFLPM
jgi:hypothetical protein